MGSHFDTSVKRNRLTSEVYKTFLETYIPIWMTGKEIQVSGDYSRQFQSSLIKSCYRLLIKNKFDTWDHPLILQMCAPPIKTAMAI